LVKYLSISSYIRKPFLIHDFVPLAANTGWMLDAFILPDSERKEMLRDGRGRYSFLLVLLTNVQISARLH
jgi:hypothetical protein